MTRPVRIHQLLASITPGDAISDEVFQFRKILRDAGYESEIFCDRAHPKLHDDVFYFEDYMQISGPDELVILHYSIGNDVSKLAYHIPDNKIIIYHNITPWHFAVGVHDTLPRDLYVGRKELAAFAEKTILAIGDSEYNRQELVEMGFPNTAVMPLPINFSYFDSVEPDPVTLEAFNDDKTNIVFVGRVIPNKKHEDCISAYANYKKNVDWESRLILVGDYTPFQRYRKQLNYHSAEVGVPEIYFTGHVTLQQLVAYYKMADVFLCMSEHEGFCVPLLEAMNFGLPVMAYQMGPIADTMGGAGVLIEEKDYDQISLTIDKVVKDKAYRKELIAGQRKRLQAFTKTPYEQILLGHIDRAIELKSQKG